MEEHSRSRQHINRLLQLGLELPIEDGDLFVESDGMIDICVCFLQFLPSVTFIPCSIVHGFDGAFVLTGCYTVVHDTASDRNFISSLTC
jgi:hypothetical protein